MQTCVVLNNRLYLTPEVAETVGLREGDSADLTPSDDRLLVTPADDGVELKDLRFFLDDDLLRTLGWDNGGVVGVESDDGRLTVARVEHPTDSSLTAPGEDGPPLPPHWLIQMVIGNPRRDRFVVGGHNLARFFADLIREHLPENEHPTVMDFGCGCGRVARVLPEYLPCEMFGCDITPQAVEWCRQNLRGNYLMSAENPPLALDDALLDAFYAFSVMTHLDEDHQAAWLTEWGRLVKPGGLLLVTYHGEGFLAASDPPIRGEIEAIWESSGFVFPQDDFWRGVFPDYYGNAYQTHEYVREHWGRWFEVIEQRPADETPLPQDLAVLRRL